jgi:hypothetical protein
MNDDQRIMALFAAPAREPDTAFVLRVERALEAERRLELARAGLWRRFGIEALATGIVLLAFLLLGRLAPEASEITALHPATAAVLLLACWFAVELTPAASRR